jgi:hypothetical protein
MNRNNPSLRAVSQYETDEDENSSAWKIEGVPGICNLERGHFAFRSSTVLAGIGQTVYAYSPDWAQNVPGAIEKLYEIASERKRNELRLSLLEIAYSELKSQVQKLLEFQSHLVTVNTLSPEPYELLKPFNISVKPSADEYEASWYDPNIHTTGDNEEEAISNLKSLILDYFDSFSEMQTEQLGVEPKRQLLIMKQFIKKLS